MELNDPAILTDEQRALTAAAAILGIGAAANQNNFVFTYQGHYYNSMAKAWVLDNQPWPAVDVTDILLYPGQRFWGSELRRALLVLPTTN